MSPTVPPNADPKLDLVLERILPIPPEQVFRAWTTPEILKQWFCPKPWETIVAEIDLRPGGIFRTVMRSPEGQEFPGTGCILEVVENEKFAWTGALLPGYRPLSAAAQVEQQVPFLFSAVITLEPHPQGTKYTATAIHADEEGATKHAAMGFHEGWGIVADQLVVVMKELAGAGKLEHA